MMNDIITCLIVGYLFGCISTSYLIGKMYNIDIRDHGSGNAGATNTMRVLGKQAGILVYLGDCIKCALAIFIMVIIYSKNNSAFDPQLIKLITGFGVVLGHNYPFWLKFKGGKGIAVTSAVILIFCLPKYWICPAICLIAFVAILQYSRYVSLGSLTVVTIFLLYVAIRFIGDDKYNDIYLQLLLFAFLFTLSAYITHRANIVRLIKGTENKMGEKKDKNTQNNKIQNNNNPNIDGSSMDNYDDEYDDNYDEYNDNYGENYSHNISNNDDFEDSYRRNMSNNDNFEDRYNPNISINNNYKDTYNHNMSNDDIDIRLDNNNYSTQSNNGMGNNYNRF